MPTFTGWAMFFSGLNVLHEKNVTSALTTVTKHFHAGVQMAKLAGITVNDSEVGFA